MERKLFKHLNSQELKKLSSEENRSPVFQSDSMTSFPKDVSTKAYSLALNKQQMALGVWDAYLETNCEQGYRKSTVFIQIKKGRGPKKNQKTAGINWHIRNEVNS